jgi:hypothetical protein
VVRPPCPSVQLRASLLAQDPASRVQALLSVPRPRVQPLRYPHSWSAYT